RRSVWRLRRRSEGPSRPRGGSKTARHTAPRRGLGPLLPSRSPPLPRPPTRHVPASPAPRALLSLARPIFPPVPSTSPAQPACEWHGPVYLRALPRQRPRHAESAHVAPPGLVPTVIGRETNKASPLRCAAKFDQPSARALLGDGTTRPVWLQKIPHVAVEI